MKPSPSRRYWFLSDLHIDHTNVIHLSNRPFPNINEMEDAIVRNINKVVAVDDTLVLVGDICLGKKASWVRFLSKINTKNLILIKGNHDSWQAIPKDMFSMVVEQMTIRLGGRLFVVSHYPYRVSWWKRLLIRKLHKSLSSPKRPMDRGLWLLHGHDHRKTRLVHYHPRMFNIGCDANNFSPVSDKEIASIVQREEDRRAAKKANSITSKILQFLTR